MGLGSILGLEPVFPAHAGMSPSLGNGGPPIMCFPRSRGDEPVDNCLILVGGQFSPLTRG